MKISPTCCQMFYMVKSLLRNKEGGEEHCAIWFNIFSNAMHWVVLGRFYLLFILTKKMKILRKHLGGFRPPMARDCSLILGASQKWDSCPSRRHQTQISLLSFSYLSLNKYWQIMTNNGKYWQILTNKQTKSSKVELLPVEAPPNPSRFPSCLFHICHQTNTGKY